MGSLTERLVQQTGIGEIRLLEPALKAASKRPVVFIKPPHFPNALGLSYFGVPLEKIMLLRSGSTADTLCTSEQVFENEHLRCRPTLAGAHPCRVAAPSNSVCAVIRVIAVCRATACGPTRRIPASLRLAIRPATNGVQVSIVKRKRPIGVDPFDVVLELSPILLSPHGRSTKPSRVLAPTAMQSLLASTASS
jgi:cell division inhibitor SulA/protein ImuA